MELSSVVRAPDDASARPPVPVSEIPLRRNLEYLAWLGGDVASGIGSGIGAFALPLIAFASTGSLVATGIVGLVQGIGLLFGLLPGGVLADRVDRRRLRLLSGMLGALTHLALALVLVTGHAGMVTLATVAGVDRFRAALFGSASDAMLKQLVSSRQLPAAMAVNEGRDAAVELAAGPVGGALLAWHLAAPALAQTLSCLANVVCTLLMRGDYRPRSAEATSTSWWTDLAEGVRWIMGQRVRVQIVLAAALVNLGSNGALLAITLMLADAGVPTVRIGLLTTVFAAAVLAGSVAASWVVARVPTGMLTVVQLLVIAGVTALLPLLSELWMIAVAYAVIGIGLAPLNAAIMGFFMHITPRDMLGRAGAMTGLLAMGMMPLAPALAGWGLEHWGAVVTLVIFAGVCAAGALVFLGGGPARRIPVSGRWESFAQERGMTGLK
ncbi:MAG: hypothetical protein DI611_09345 [Brachybacterium faecium]|nr:MAG: hypothetical protein DI611_09345 [Brachybacterium faecium]